MYTMERKLWSEGYAAICGVDEAGRGPLAGPVYAAAVILDPQKEITGLRDSKQLSEKRRRELAAVIKAESLTWAVACSTVEEIFEINILQATFLAMSRAVSGLITPPDYHLVDGNRDPSLTSKQPVQCVVKGDSLSASIAAASILAKTERDGEMLRLDTLYPQYGFAKHKGYPTSEHKEALRQYGLSPVHRKAFRLYDGYVPECPGKAR